MHSIFREVRAAMSRGECPNLRRCEVLLVVQKRQHLDPFLNTLVSATENDLGGRTAVSVFVDSERGAAGGGGGDCNNAYRGVPFRVGRANSVSAIKRLGEAARRAEAEAAESGASSSSLLLSPHVFVCGPPGLAATADTACLKEGVDFHKEVFAF